MTTGNLDDFKIVEPDHEADNDRLRVLIGLLVSELTVQTGHWEKAPPGVAVHDKRMRTDDGEPRCAICALLRLTRPEARV